MSRMLKSKIIIILLLLGICLRIGEMDSLFVREILDKAKNSLASADITFSEHQVHDQKIIHYDTIVQEYNEETIHARRSFTSLKNPKRLFDRGLQKNPLFLCTINVYFHNLSGISLFLSKEMFQELRNDLIIVEFIHQKDGKKSDAVLI